MLSMVRSLLLLMVLSSNFLLHGAAIKKDDVLRKEIFTALQGYKSYVGCFLRGGGDLNNMPLFLVNKCYTPLSAAVACDDGLYVDYLVKHGAKPLAPVPTFTIPIEGIPNARSLLFEARTVRAVEWLIKCGADVNARDAHVYKEPLLSYVARDEEFHEDIIDILVAHKADVAAVDEQGWTALHQIVAMSDHVTQQERQLAKVKKLVAAGVPLHVPALDPVCYGLSCAEIIKAKLSCGEIPFLRAMLPLVATTKEKLSARESERLAAEIAQRSMIHDQSLALSPVHRCVLVPPALQAKLTPMDIDAVEDEWEVGRRHKCAALQAEFEGIERDRQAIAQAARMKKSASHQKKLSQLVDVPLDDKDKKPTKEESKKSASIACAAAQAKPAPAQYNPFASFASLILAS